ncbi:inactive protein RESTRICTED TEV MOVEMENT 1-like [Silene latifolia]|uniref:inactive protein RESTRICTED TEV MOVEMENT 1-like n=1 Tax=Silene latifolia TaxID=37657 RepID=UPI003D778B33
MAFVVYISGAFFIIAMKLSPNRRINSLQFQYLEDGKMKLFPVYGDGSFAGSYFQTVEFSDPKEYIIGLKGATTGSPYYGLSNLTFETNYRTYGPFGCGVDEHANFNFRFGPENHFAGFYGTFNSNKLSSIGVYVRRSSEKLVKLSSVKAEDGGN